MIAPKQTPPLHSNGGSSSYNEPRAIRRSQRGRTQHNLLESGLERPELILLDLTMPVMGRPKAANRPRP
jgi:CheY-like chemotaxis protein